MAIINPFRGVRYNCRLAGKLDDLVTPPYDVINKNAEEAYLGRNPYNIIRLDVTKDPGKKQESRPDRHRPSAERLSAWMKGKILQRDRKPALYPYDVEYTLAKGTRHVRKGFICLVELAEFNEKIVFPHEQTFGSVIQDRLDLTRACRAQFSQVFSVFSDPRNQVVEMLDDRKGQPVAAVTDADGCRHQLWQMTDRQAIADIQHFFLDKGIYIADGHHRYTTALAYRNEMLQSGSGVADRGAVENQIMMYLCPMEDPGLSILPTHRLVQYPGRLSLSELLQKLRQTFDLMEITSGSRESLLFEVMSEMEVGRNGTGATACHAFGLYHPGEDRCFLLKLKKKPDSLNTPNPENCLAELAVVILSEVIFSDVLKLDPQQCERENLITFHSDISEALDVSVKQSMSGDDTTPLLFLINPTSIGQVKQVSDAGLFMPHKSTYFYPKIVSGMVMNVFDDDGNHE